MVPENIVNLYEHIFVGFITDAHYEVNPDTLCGEVYGNIEVVERLKGDPGVVPNTLKIVLIECDDVPLVGRRDDVPVGNHVLIFSNGEQPELKNWIPNQGGGTRKIRYIKGQTCVVDQYRQLLQIEHEDRQNCQESLYDLEKY